MQKKLKSPWVLTDIPKNTKIKLWRLMNGNPTYPSWCRAIASKSGTVDQDEIFAKDEDDSIKTSRDTYKSLKKELMLMPQEEVETLPEDLKRWVLSIRPELKENLLPSDSRKTLTAAERDVKNAQNQIEHIMKIRELAISIRAKVQAIPGLESDDCLGIVYVNLTKVAFELVTHPYWIWLSAHLGAKAKEFEMLAGECGETLIRVSLFEDQQRVKNAKLLLTDSLFPISFYGDTKEWKAWGYDAICPIVTKL